MSVSLAHLDQKVAELTDRAIFRLSGEDRERYLNGQITQKVALATNDQAVYTAVTDAKGKMEGDAFVRQLGDTLLIDCPIELREDMMMRLDKYIIADDAVLEDITDELSLFHSATEITDLSIAILCWRCNRFGSEGSDLLVPKNTIPPAIEVLEEIPAEWEQLRILKGVPKWGAELTTSTLPPEADLEDTAISYNKGCYIGQEVISRVKSAGKVNRSITRFTLSTAVEVPCDIPNQDEATAKPAGTITSVTEIDGTIHALGYRNRKWADTTEFTLANGATATALPKS